MTGNSARPNPRRASTDAVAVPVAWSQFVREEQEDRRIRRWSVGIGLILHLALAAVLSVVLPPPTAGNELPEVDKPVVRPIRPLTFKRTEVPPTPEVPPPSGPRMPVPVPEFTAPEPVAVPSRFEVDLAFDQSDLESMFVIPAAPPARPDGPILVRGEVEAPVRLAGLDPRYTETARRVGIQGLVIVEAIVNERGSVENVKLVQGLGFGLDEAAMQAIRTWRFEPATLHGEPVAVYYTLTVNFQMD